MWRGVFASWTQRKKQSEKEMSKGKVKVKTTQTKAHVHKTRLIIQTQHNNKPNITTNKSQPCPAR